jgi:hypothetical protein
MGCLPMSDDRAAAIKDYLIHNEGADPVLARRYATLAARWERLRLAAEKGHTTPGDDVRYQELCSALKVLTKQLGLNAATVGHADCIPGITDARGRLPRDTSRYFYDDWLSIARMWE